MQGLFVYKLVAYKKEGYKQNIETLFSFVGRDAKCSYFIYCNMFLQQFHKEMKVVFFSVLSSTPAFLSRQVFLTKFATEKHTSPQHALNL